jgi:hypothetical protein
MELFEQAARIQREAIEASDGRYIPMIQENVRGAQPWVGQAQWHYGSYYLWGDVPALMPIPVKAVKVGGFSWSDFGKPGYVGQGFNTLADQQTRALSDGVKVGKSVNWSAYGTPGYVGPSFHQEATKNMDGVKHSAPGVRANGKGSAWFDSGPSVHGSKSSARKAASARIAKIPFPLASYIARTFKPLRSAA